MSKKIDLNSFPKTSKNQWISLLKNSKIDVQALNWGIEEDLCLEPYYDANDLKGLNYLEEFFSEIRPSQWHLSEYIAVENEQLCNQQILDCIQNGCRFIILEIEKRINLQRVLKNIPTDGTIISYVDKTRDPTFLREMSQDVTGFIHSENSIFSTGYQMKEGKILDSIKDLLVNFEKQTYIIRKAHPHFFMEIASLRALRYLLYREKFLSSEVVHIHTQIPLEKEEYQYFFNSVVGLGSIFGGTNSICFTHQNKDKQLTQNIGHIIREEVGLKFYDDPLRGSYFLEVLTDQIIKRCSNQIKK